MRDSSEIFLHYVKTHLKALHLAARQYVRCEEIAHDLVQETLLRAWKNFSSSEKKECQRAWLFAIMRNVIIDWQRMNKRRIKLSSLSQVELTEITPIDLSEPFCPLPAMDEERFREFLDDRVVAALDALQAPYREVVFLSVAGELNYREIAEVLDCPVGTVMSRMARARRILRERLASFISPPKIKKK